MELTAESNEKLARLAHKMTGLIRAIKQEVDTTEDAGATILWLRELMKEESV